MVIGCTFGRICGIMVSDLDVVFYVVISSVWGGGIYFKSVLGLVWGVLANKNMGVGGVCPCLRIVVLWLENSVYLWVYCGLLLLINLLYLFVLS